MRFLSNLKLGYARHRAAVHEILLISAAAITYFTIRVLTAGSAQAALTNADRVMSFEQRAHLAWEESLQAVLVTRSFLVTLVNWIYVWGFWPVLIAAAILLYKYRPSQYRLFRNAILISGAIGFFFFAFFPVAPPRLANPDLVDTLTLYSRSFRALQPSGLTNQYAAFPSLHFGWNVLVTITVWRSTANILLRSATAALSVAMAAAVVLTANHYVIDLAGGLAVVFVGLAVSEALSFRTAAKNHMVEG